MAQGTAPAWLAHSCLPCVHASYICAAGVCDCAAGAYDLASVLGFAWFVQHLALSPDSQFWAGSTHPWRTLGAKPQGKNCREVGVWRYKGQTLIWSAEAWCLVT
eukprot:3541226-Ditylum_brightwellii.AAC.1